jgi:hypothetical protein
MATKFIKIEVWVIVDKSNYNMIPPALDDDGTNSFIAWPSKKEAEKGLTFQIAMGYISAETCEVVRLA